MKKISKFLVLVMLVLILAPAGLVSAAGYTLQLGTRSVLHNNLYMDSGTQKTWTTSSASIVSIVSVAAGGNDCTIEAKGIGSCSVYCKIAYPSYETVWIDNGLGGGYWATVPTTKYETSTYSISVTPSGDPVIASINLAYDGGKTLVQGETFRLPVTLRLANNWLYYDFSKLTWQSSNTAVATVNSYGIVTAKTAGSAVISAKTPEGLKDSVWVTVSGYSGYTAISTPQQLNAIRNNPAGKYYLTRNITFTSADFTAGGAFYNGGAGWTPISNFTGILNGNQFAIENLQVKTTGSAGLFATAKGGWICNLEMKNCKISGGSYAGAVSGQTDGTILYNCLISSGTINGSIAGGVAGFAQYGRMDFCLNKASVSGKSLVGGIVGKNTLNDIWFSKNQGIITGNLAEETGGIAGRNNFSKIFNCSNVNTVNGYLITGGITGFNSIGRIQNCYNLGKVAGKSTSTNTSTVYIAGGITGRLTDEGKIINSYNAGSVALSFQAGFGVSGGIAGNLSILDFTTGNPEEQILNCYNAGSFQSSGPSQKTGGIAGTVFVSTTASEAHLLRNCYYLNTTPYSVITMPNGKTANVAALSAAQMKAAVNFSGYDFSKTWTISPTSSYAYPKLRSSSIPVFYKKCKVTYQPQGGTAVAAVTVNYYSLLTAPKSPIRTGYTFSGWYTDAACTKAWSFSASRVTGNLSLYAKWVD